MSRLTIEQAMQRAIAHHTAGQLPQAEQLYQQIVSVQPGNAEALHLLGVANGQTGRLDPAIDLITQAIAIAPNNPAYYFNRGLFLEKQEKLSQAGEDYQRAVDRNPAYLEAHIHLGNIWRRQGDLDRALACYKAALSFRPDSAEVHVSVGNILQDREQFDEAITNFQTALKIAPGHALAAANLTLCLIQQGVERFKAEQFAPGLESFRQAVRISPNDANAQTKLANAFNLRGMSDEAIEGYHRAIKCYEELPDAREDLSATWRVLGNVVGETGDISGAVAAYRRALEFNPNSRLASDSLLFSLPSDPTADAAEILRESVAWNDRIVSQLKPVFQPHLNEKTADRRLRIGYVSAEFNCHVASFYFLPLLTAHDREKFEMFCYANIEKADEITDIMRERCENWRDIYSLSDEEVAEQIRRDRIDILVDLTMHMGNGRLPVFAFKPAPVQVCWLGYPGTTGLAAMDYRLTDPYLDPPGQHDEFYSEKSIRLPETFWCFEARSTTSHVNALPAASNGFITFGCLNNIRKVNPSVLELWAKVMLAVKNSRLLMLAPMGKPRELILDKMKSNGVARDRIEFVDRQPRMAYLDTYNRIDFGLDTFPYNGHTTTLDSLWMGVPVLTLVGKTIVARAGLSLLTNVGLTEFIAHSPEEFVRKASEISTDLSRLSTVRAGLRNKITNSSLMDTTRFARGLEDALRTIWKIYCDN